MPRILVKLTAQLLAPENKGPAFERLVDRENAAWGLVDSVLAKCLISPAKRLPPADIMNFFPLTRCVTNTTGEI